MSIWDNTIRASNLFTYKNLSEKRVGSAKDTRLEETFTFMPKKQRMNTDYVSKDMRPTTLGPVRFSIENEKRKKKKASKPCVVNGRGAGKKSRYEHET